MRQIFLILPPLFIYIIYVFGLFYQKPNFEISKISDEIRTQFKVNLKELPTPEYDKVLGFTPSKQIIELGRLLFSDTILSRNNDVSCATCHLTNHGFADGNSLNVGALGEGGPNGDNVGESFATGKLSINRNTGSDGLGREGKRFMFRNSLSTLNVVYRADPYKNIGLFHDGRFGDLKFQVLLPIHTGVEMCGTNPVPHPLYNKNPFRENGPIFKNKKILIIHSHYADPHTGIDTGRFNVPKEIITHVPTFRKNGALSIPTRNECLAIAIAKLQNSAKYMELFKNTFKNGKINDRNLSLALASFVSTHVANNSPYDRFVKGENILPLNELIGLGVFLTDIGESFRLGDKKYNGAGCVSCHAPPLFGDGFASLGIKSDKRSPLTQSAQLFQSGTGFIRPGDSPFGRTPKCIVSGKTHFANTNYHPDIGKGIIGKNLTDCFQFRVPQLRNVIETYPYYHHGSERGEGILKDFRDLKKIARQTLRRVIEYHLRGPVDLDFIARKKAGSGFFDSFFQLDPLIPYQNMKFTRQPKSNMLFPVQLNNFEIEALLDFISFSLWDQNAVKKGYFDNSLNHPKTVPSGLLPTISRDDGNQLEFLPFDKE
ncbi:MAG: hypothetical protein H6622_10840 [Halobacteriovoraceae bacterium]|nr:hypothetical protein [Halobacteriovoraceae bacterium]